MTLDLISVVIVTWNGVEHLEGCLSAVAAQRGVDAETILVDNASSDRTAEFVRERFPWVRLCLLDRNQGFAGGNNAGAAIARGKYLAFLNNDTVADAEWLRTLRAGIDEAAGFALATSRIVYMHDPEIVDSAGDGMTRWGGAFKRHHGGRASEVSESREVFGACGAAFAISRQVFDELGGFDVRFFASHEDVDLSYRARLRGYRCRYVAESVVRHRGSSTLGRRSAQAVFYGQRNLEWVFVKNTPTSILLRTLPGHLLYNGAAALHFARHGLLRPFLAAKWQALSNLGPMLKSRSEVQAAARVTAAAIWEQLEPRWLALKRREKRFDAHLAESSR